MDLTRYTRGIVDTLQRLWYRATGEAAHMKHPYQQQKFYELVLYIAWTFKDDPSFGRIKLAKLLFNSDFRHFRETGHPISGATYIKDEFGHNPKQLLHAELDLEARGDSYFVYGESEEEPRFIADKDRRRLIPKRRGKVEEFLSPSEKRMVDAVLLEYRETPAIAMSEESHKTLGWRIADWREAIPYESVFLRKPGADDRARAQKIAAARGLE
jgi:hypothetical protein